MNEITVTQVVFTVVGYLAVFALGGFCATVMGQNSLARLYGQARAALNQALQDMVQARQVLDDAMKWRQQGYPNGKDHGGVERPAGS